MNLSCSSACLAILTACLDKISRVCTACLDNNSLVWTTFCHKQICTEVKIDIGTKRKHKIEKKENTYLWSIFETLFNSVKRVYSIRVWIFKEFFVIRHYCGQICWRSFCRFRKHWIFLFTEQITFCGMKMTVKYPLILNT